MLREANLRDIGLHHVRRSGSFDVSAAGHRSDRGLGRRLLLLLRHLFNGRLERLNFECTARCALAEVRFSATRGNLCSSKSSAWPEGAPFWRDEGREEGKGRSVGITVVWMPPPSPRNLCKTAVPAGCNEQPDVALCCGDPDASTLNASPSPSPLETLPSRDVLGLPRRAAGAGLRIGTRSPSSRKSNRRSKSISPKRCGGAPWSQVSVLPASEAARFWIGHQSGAAANLGPGQSTLRHLTSSDCRGFTPIEKKLHRREGDPTARTQCLSLTLQLKREGAHHLREAARTLVQTFAQLSVLVVFRWCEARVVLLLRCRHRVCDGQDVVEAVEYVLKALKELGEPTWCQALVDRIRRPTTATPRL